MDRGDAALRHLEPAAGPLPPARRRAARQGRARRARSCCSASARPTATSGSSRAPTSYDIFRDKDELAQILSFGGGRHFCLGANLARLEARVALTEPGRAGPLGRGRARPVRPGALGQRARLRRAADHASRCADGERQVRAARPPPGRRHRRLAPASAPRPRCRLGQAGYPVALGARRTDKLRGGRHRRSARTAARPSRTRSTSPTTTRSRRSPRRSADLGDIEVVVSNAGAVAPGTITEVDPERFARELDLNLVGAHRLVRAFVPAMVERRRGDIVFVSSDVAVRAAAVHGGVLRRQVGARGPGGDACRWSSRAPASARSVVRPGPTWSEMGSRLGRRRGGVRAQPVGAVRPGPAPALPQAGRHRRRDHHGRQRAARRPPEPGRGQPRSAPGGAR